MNWNLSTSLEFSWAKFLFGSWLDFLVLIKSSFTFVVNPHRTYRSPNSVASSCHFYLLHSLFYHFVLDPFVMHGTCLIKIRFLGISSSILCTLIHWVLHWAIKLHSLFVFHDPMCIIPCWVLPFNEVFILLISWLLFGRLSYWGCKFTYSFFLKGNITLAREVLRTINKVFIFLVLNYFYTRSQFNDDPIKTS